MFHINVLPLRNRPVTKTALLSDNANRAVCDPLGSEISAYGAANNPIASKCVNATPPIGCRCNLAKISSASSVAETRRRNEKNAARTLFRITVPRKKARSKGAFSETSDRFTRVHTRNQTVNSCRTLAQTATTYRPPESTYIPILGGAPQNP